MNYVRAFVNYVQIFQVLKNYFLNNILIEVDV